MSPGPVRGPEGVRQNMQMLLAAFPDLRVEIVQIISSGNFIATQTRATGTHKGTFAGIPATNKSVVVPGATSLNCATAKQFKAGSTRTTPLS